MEKMAKREFYYKNYYILISYPSKSLGYFKILPEDAEYQVWEDLLYH
jgi:hypothetical protein